MESFSFFILGFNAVVSVLCGGTCFFMANIKLLSFEGIVRIIALLVFDNLDRAQNYNKVQYTIP